MDERGKTRLALTEELLHSSAFTLPFPLLGLLAPGLWWLGLWPCRGLFPPSGTMDVHPVSTCMFSLSWGLRVPCSLRAAWGLVRCSWRASLLCFGRRAWQGPFPKAGCYRPGLWPSRLCSGLATMGPGSCTGKALESGCRYHAQTRAKPHDAQLTAWAEQDEQVVALKHGSYHAMATCMFSFLWCECHWAVYPSNYLVHFLKQSLVYFFFFGIGFITVRTAKWHLWIANMHHDLRQ